VKSDEEDPRARLVETDSDEEVDNRPVHGLDLPGVGGPASVSHQHIEVPEPNNTEEQRYRQDTVNSIPEPVILPQVIVPPKRTTSKTAALIELYRERERETVTDTKPPASPVTPVSPTPSRLPVRSASSLLKDSPVIPEAPPDKPVSPAPPPPESEAEPTLSPELEEPLRVVLDETGRASPGRYIHGAPLHNVLEEEEEE